MKQKPHSITSNLATGLRGGCVMHYDTSHASLLNNAVIGHNNLERVKCDTGGEHIDTPMLCADWPAAGSLTYLQTRSVCKHKP